VSDERARIARRRPRRGDPPTDPDGDKALEAAERFRMRLGYVLLAASAVCLCLAAWLMHSAAAALIPAAAAFGMAGWDAAR